MGRLIYSTMGSLDGYSARPDGTFDFGLIDEEVHRHVNETARPIGTHLLGRRMYDVMSYWETAPVSGDEASAYELDFARIWQAADKVVYSRTLKDVATERTRIEHDFDPAAVARLKDESDRDLGIGGPTLAALAIRAGLVDEFQLYLGPALAGGGLPFFPPGVDLPLRLVDEQRFGNGGVYLAYAPR
ncbi:dihydrofolate reductase family protein [Luteipulveratus mongoliensis]|uniref:Deaminase/reductase n=1 Tax=Luteipulveratus mongoliensis TaxID=571913 RepID=A0A0K1JGQ4_9MICO|nr:dihydrofolate reductase family protein [Luteipulveratus mongoliensis]AKU15886.1 deaminase/reductase [Luteipulveratus mongoliensis]